jgi:hypothetical protein
VCQEILIIVIFWGGLVIHGATAGRPGPPQIQNLRPLGPPIETSANANTEHTTSCC